MKRKNLKEKILSGIVSLLLVSQLLASSASAQTIFPNRGGTGTTTIPTFGQVLVGNGSGTFDIVATSSLGITGGGGGGGVGWASTTDPESIKTTGTGNVGIATSSPYARLSVVGEIVASFFTATSTTATSTFASGLKIGNPFGIKFEGYSGDPQLFAADPTTGIHFDGPGILSIHNGGIQTALFSSTNKVGIGTSSPYAKLSVVGEIVGANFTATSTINTSTFNGDISATSNISIASTSGSNLITNGTPTSATGWILGSPWAFSGNKFTHASNGTGNLIQSAIPGLTIYHQYILTYTLSDYTTGTLAVSGSGTSLTSRAANGTYSERFRANTTAGNVVFNFSNTGRGSVSNISLAEIKGNIFTDGYLVFKDDPQTDRIFVDGSSMTAGRAFYISTSGGTNDFEISRLGAIIARSLATFTQGITVSLTSALSTVTSTSITNSSLITTGTLRVNSLGGRGVLFADDSALVTNDVADFVYTNSKRLGVGLGSDLLAKLDVEPGEACTGTPTDCEPFVDTPAYCTGIGCSYHEGTGEFVSCDGDNSFACADFNEDETACNDHACSFDGGQPNTCPDYSDEENCNGDPSGDCSWNGDSCDGDNSTPSSCTGAGQSNTCPAQTDQESCDAAGCTSILDTSSCTGTPTAGGCGVIDINDCGNFEGCSTGTEPAANLRGEVTIGAISGDGTGKVVCVKSNGFIGTCSDAPDGSGVCTCN